MEDNQDKIIDEILSKTGEIFGVENDPFQVPVTRETWNKMLYLHPKSILYRLNDKGGLMAWFGVVPTTKKLMTEFIEGRITEKEMFDRTTKQDKPEALYLGGVVVLPEYRGKGVAKGLLKEAIDIFQKINPDINLFFWAFSEEGRSLAEKVSKELGVEILSRKSKN